MRPNSRTWVLLTMAAVRDRLPNANGWYNADVTVTFAAADALSGIATVTGPMTLTAEGANQSASPKRSTAMPNPSSTSVPPR